MFENKKSSIYKLNKLILIKSKNYFIKTILLWFPLDFSQKRNI